MPGRFFVIGVGPGDPELLTFKAARVLREVQCIFVPKGREEGTSLALSIVQKALSLENKDIVELHFPMMKTALHPGPLSRGGKDDAAMQELDAKWNEAAESVLDTLNAGLDAAFLTIGDPCIYSTFFYLLDRMLQRMPGLSYEIVPGISSINASAARAGISLGLGNERIAVLPANYLDRLEQTLEQFDTVVLMKINKVLDEVRNTLDRMGIVDKAVCVAHAGMEDERVWRDIRTVQKMDLDYFSLMIVRKR